MDWYSILIKYGVDVPQAEQFIIHCPFHQDGRQSCSINLEKGVWICFAGCGQGSLKYFIWKLSDKSWEEIQEEFETPTFDFDFGSFTTEDIETDKIENQSFYAGELTPLKTDHWIYKRGFDTLTLQRWGCLENKYRDLVIPVDLPNEDILGWITRRIQATPKYLFSKGFQKSKTLFGLKHLKEVETLFIVEGALDAMWLDQHGYSSVAVLGASISQAQIDIISTYHPSELVLCLDADDAGQKGIDKATIDMKDRFMLSFIKFPKEKKDFQDIRNSKELYTVIKNRSIW